MHGMLACTDSFARKQYMYVNTLASVCGRGIVEQFGTVIMCACYSYIMATGVHL